MWNRLTSAMARHYDSTATNLVAYRMLKLSKKADYALIAVRHLATHRGEPSQSASDIAEAYGISAPLLAKVLQRLAKHGLLTARHGSSGGYVLARHPKEISALDVINAVDRPVVIIVRDEPGLDRFHRTVREPLRRVNEVSRKCCARSRFCKWPRIRLTLN
jgi:Rrf2 family protein